MTVLTTEKRKLCGAFPKNNIGLSCMIKQQFVVGCEAKDVYR